MVVIYIRISREYMEVSTIIPQGPKKAILLTIFFLVVVVEK